MTETQPVEPGDIVTVTIEDYGSEGDGLAFVDGLAVFVPDTQVGDEVQVEIDHVADQCAFAEIAGVLERGP